MVLMQVGLRPQVQVTSHMLLNGAASPAPANIFPWQNTGFPNAPGNIKNVREIGPES